MVRQKVQAKKTETVWPGPNVKLMTTQIHAKKRKTVPWRCKTSRGTNIRCFPWEDHNEVSEVVENLTLFFFSHRNYILTSLLQLLSRLTIRHLWHNLKSVKQETRLIIQLDSSTSSELGGHQKVTTPHVRTGYTQGDVTLPATKRCWMWIGWTRMGWTAIGEKTPFWIVKGIGFVYLFKQRLNRLHDWIGRRILRQFR